MKKVLLLLLVPLILLPLLKANTPPILHATIDGEEKPLILSKLKVEVKISGLIAETKKTMTFYNPYNRELEGELTFPLPEGAFVSGYALDINGQMVDGVVVEKERGWVVYDDIVQQGIDPGLVEWVKGNHFKTYVYPILAKNTRTIMIRYLSQVTRKKNKTYLHIPMNYNLKVEEFSLKVRIQTPATPGYIKKKDTANVQNAPWQRSLITQTTKKDFLLDKDINIPVPVKDVRNVTVEQNHDGHYYFSIHPIPPVKAAPKITGGTDTEVNKKAPKHITILWDASGSMGKTDHQKELKLLKEYFSRYKKQKIRVELKVIRLRGTLTKRFKIKHGNTKKLFKAIKKIHYDGATSLNTIVPAQEESTADFYLLFTDGNHNFGKWKTVGSFKSPLYVITAMGGIKNNYLRSLAYTSGGNLLDIAAKKPRPISSLIGVSPYIFLSATAVKGTVTGLYPTIAQPLKHPFTVTGKLLKDNAVVTLNYGINGKILQQIPYEITRKNATESTILRTFWAQEKIRHLMSTPGNKNDMVATGKKYGLVTPGTSLIVLESLRQYLRYRIKPPESLPEMRKKYEEEITGDAEYEKEKLEDIVTLWQERVDWWEKDFKVPELPPKRKKNAILREVGRDRSTVREVTRESSTVREVTRERNTESETAQNSQENRRQSGPITFSTSIPIEQTLDAGKGRNSVYGVVMLEDGCVIPGAKITLSKDNLNLETVTTEQGLYGIKGLPRGSYTIKAELEGFGSETVAGIHLQGGKKIKMVPIFMEPGTIKQEIVITFSPKDIAMMSPDIILKPWDPDTPYIEKIKKAGPKGAFDIYMKLKKEYGDSPAFYLDCSDYFCKQNRIETGLQILSNIAELELSDAFFLRAYGHRLAGLGLMERSVECFREVLATKPEEPQSYRDLALVLARMKQYKEAVELLYKIVTREWLDEESYPDIEIIALMEINRIIAKAGGNINFDIDARFIKLLDVDIRIVLTWGSADTDIDLYIEDPNGEQSDFKNTLTRIGGLHSKDNTGGYGPEEYVLKRAIPGKYIIEGDYFGSDADKLPGPVTLNLDFFTNYGRKNEEKKSITLRLSTVDETIVIGEIIF